MVNIARYVEVQQLLDSVEGVIDRLTPNEIEMFRKLQAKHAEPGQVDFDDVTCLEVILRNVEIRKGYRVDPGETASRVINLTPTRGPRRH